MKLHLLEIVAAISNLLDLAGVDHYLHGKRVATMATECAHILHLDLASHAGLVLAALLHDLDTTMAQPRTPLAVEFESEDARPNCERGAWLSWELSSLSHLAPVIRYHYTHWEKLPKGLDPELGRDTNLIFLLDRVDARTAPHIGAADFRQHRDASRRMITEGNGSAFSLSDLAYALASRLGLVKKIAVAAVLHDIGGMSVSDALRERTHPERAIVIHHTFRVYQILRSIHGFEDIVLWIAMHHESLDWSTDAGSSGNELPLPTRILAIADACYTLAYEETAHYLTRLGTREAQGNSISPVCSTCGSSPNSRNIGEFTGLCWHRHHGDSRQDPSGARQDE